MKKNVICYTFIFIVITIALPAQEFWEQTNGPYSNGIRAIVVNSKGYLFVAGADGNFATSDSGIYRSTDDGDTWVQINNGLTSRDVQSLAVNSNDHIFAAANGIYRSIDDGNSWIKISENHSGLLAVNSKNYIFVACSHGIYRSTDDGNTWVEIPYIQNVRNDVKSIAIDSNDDLFIGTAWGDIYRSTDDGDTWNISYQYEGIIFEFVRVFALAVNSKDQIIAGNEYGYLCRSTDHGETWQDLFDFYPYFVWKIEIDSNDHLFATTGREGGIYYSTDNGETWNQIVDSLTTNVYVSAFAVDSKNRLFAGTNKGIVLRNRKPITLIHKVNYNIPTSCELGQNYPNPFNTSTTIAFYILNNSEVSIVIYDQLGKEICHLLNKRLTAGRYEVKWMAAGLPSGLYFYQLKAGSFVRIKKLLLIK
ncbi:MAG: T9SS type A sorting domain-containing protein [Bacteroidales bacterium]|nr:T9SS type A sorting domain-containing protein [Bacteroidales bacterium]